jgi:drug/metabolite transporter (DMT)-like permease
VLRGMMGVLSIAITLAQAYPEPRSTPLAPAWLVLPMAAIVMLILAGHCQALQRVDMPESRRRIRTAGDLLMLGVAPLLAYAFAIDRGDDPRTFVIVWALIVGLLALIILVATIDAANNMRLARLMRERLRKEKREIFARGTRRAEDPRA